MQNHFGSQMDDPGYDLYFPEAPLRRLHLSESSFFRESVKNDLKAPLIIGRGMIACNTPALQEWWNGKRHHK